MVYCEWRACGFPTPKLSLRVVLFLFSCELNSGLMLRSIILFGKVFVGHVHVHAYTIYMHAQ